MFTALHGNPLPIRQNWLLASIMSGDRIARALARIESASSRIEAAASSAAVPDVELTRKYATLHDEAKLALSELDQLIGQLSQ